MSLPSLPQRILLAVESAALAQAALDAVLPIAQRASAVVDLVHVWEPIPFVPPNAGFHHEGATRSYQEIAESEGRQALAAIAKAVKEGGVTLGKQQVIQGNPAEVIA
jgi:nucleotide-binding universal stress UspA family protein